ncbi:MULTISPECIES: ATP-binding cassette domain-containing protein [Thermomonospora]|uniref:ABC transporter related protein n=1 Tax=Thermomonospora curvata (strain ATCC 19995 / DSM 43183 / JCM 3096 / KCTC 9072 / NBRC 15933 / NCIMB 10081 / Henssen B9) TaxID=471852 RepID=D1ADZ0_THECD|nr:MULTISPECIES: ATP-binding cassette domain-containing protein [Thermomonospora]ACY99416.1 ABC transporter related protein [Thermomonospora curvata DSM 43183]PKK12463.1 MAG: ABC transporter [Thermomonospora sp. CIF 1]
MIADCSAIVARGMGVRRAGRWLLRPADFDVTGGVIGMAGPPGTGKSTLLATFATLRRHHAGTLGILGHEIRSARDARAIRSRIGYLPADFWWTQGFTVAEFVAYSAYYRRVPASAGPAMLRRLELADVAEVEVALLPPEARLRAGLAAVCVHEPDLVLLDEPLTGLTGGEADALTALLGTVAPTVVVTARRVEELAGWCDRVLVLSRGRLTEHTAASPVPAEEGPARPAPAEPAGRAVQPVLERPIRPAPLIVGSGACV